MVSGSVCVSRLMIIYYDQHGKEEIKKELMWRQDTEGGGALCWNTAAAKVRVAVVDGDDDDKRKKTIVFGRWVSYRVPLMRMCFMRIYFCPGIGIAL